jgi:hypothetical protein
MVFLFSVFLFSILRFSKQLKKAHGCLILKFFKELELVVVFFNYEIFEKKIQNKQFFQNSKNWNW